MIKIAYIISSCTSGGAELLVKRLCETIIEKDTRIQVWVVCRAMDCFTVCPEDILKFESNYISDLRQRGVEVLFLEKRKNEDRMKCINNIRKFYKEFQPDVIHAHSEICAAYTAAALTGIKCKLIQTIHSIKIFYPRLIKYYLAHRIGTFVSISEEVSQSMRDVGILDKKITLIRNGVDVSAFNFSDRVFNKTTVRLIAVGRMEAEKDYPFLLKSFRLALNRLNEMNKTLPILDIIGTGSWKTLLEELIGQMDLRENVHLLGLRNDIQELLKAADIYVMSSFVEGLSLALIEAAASGLPVIATDVGSNRMLVQPDINGFLVEHGDVESFARAIIALTEDTALREKYSRNSEKIAGFFDINITAELHLRLYQNLGQ